MGRTMLVGGEASLRRRLENPSPEYESYGEGLIFLGKVLVGDEVHDLYYVLQGGGIPTIIERWSSAPEHYVAGLAFASSSIYPGIAVGLIRALKKGLLTWEQATAHVWD